MGLINSNYTPNTAPLRTGPKHKLKKVTMI